MVIRSRRIRLLRQRDEGSAMFSVLAVTSIAATLTVTALTAASGTLHRSDRDETLEQALHLAEAGVARAITAIAADPSYATTQTQPPDPVTKDWALDEAPSAPLEQAREGEYAWIVPEDADVVFGLGFVPSRTAAREVRVIRVEAWTARSLNAFDVITRASLSIPGNPSIQGGVHTNGDLLVSGNPTIGGDGTATGSFSITGAPTIGGASGGGFPPLEIPDADPRTYRSQADVDLCPDSTVRTILSGTPCTGTVIGSGLAAGWNGWKHTPGTWSISGNNATDGVYYVYQANAKLSGNLGPWSATILVEGLEVNGVLLNGDLEASGNLELIGDIVVEGSSQAIAFMTSRDIKISGNGEFTGLIHAGEHFDMSGNSQVSGQIVSSATGDSPGSPVAANRIHGNPTITHVSNAPAQSAEVSTADWREL